MKINEIYKHCQEHALFYRVSKFKVLYDYLYARFFYGFCSEDYFTNTPGYAMKNFQKRDFFSYRKWYKIMALFNNPNYVYLLDNKVEFLKYFSEYISHSFCSPKDISFNQFKEYVTKNHALLVKPINSNQGAGIYRYEPSDNLEEDYHKFIEKNEFLEEMIIQHTKMNLGAHCVNTVRVYTILDASGKAHILKAVLRVGAKNSIVDNYHAGGVIYPINIDGGFVESYGVSRVYGKPIFFQPETELLMLGFKIPNFDILKNKILHAAEKIPHVRYIGWDVAITETGIDIIEANSDADHALFGVIGLETLFYERILKYYK